MKYICRRCFEEKEETLFPKNKTYKSGRATECKTCASKRAYTYRSPLRNAMWKYHITEEQAQYFVSSTKCEICGNPQKTKKVMCIDHCHTTGQVRGALCDGCNQGIGRFGDNPEMLMKAIDYLNKYGYVAK